MMPSDEKTKASRALCRSLPSRAPGRLALARVCAKGEKQMWNNTTRRRKVTHAAAAAALLPGLIGLG
ncbi:hypothetical protein, partial [Mycolicibacter algericus]|uniref:hypothetical protein n=1 Tax=Mycolicibacter algericus TaxID=1288388 RepID=UPI003C789D1B